LVVDETRISIEANPYYAWHQKGQTPVKKVKLEIHKSKVIYGGLSLAQGLVMTHEDNKHNGLATAKFLNKIKEFKQSYHPSSKQPILLLWDGAGCHKSQEVKNWLKANPNIVELDYFPPYAPELNPQEHVWKELKRHINHLRGHTSLTEIMIEAMKFLNSKRFYYKLFSLTKESIF